MGFAFFWKLLLVLLLYSNSSDIFSCFCGCRKQCLKGFSFTMKMIFLWGLQSLYVECPKVAKCHLAVFRFKWGEMFLTCFLQDGAHKPGVSSGKQCLLCMQLCSRFPCARWWLMLLPTRRASIIMSCFRDALPCCLLLCRSLIRNRTSGPWMWSVDAKLVLHTQVVVTCKCLQKVSHKIDMNLTFFIDACCPKYMHDTLLAYCSWETQVVRRCRWTVGRPGKSSPVGTRRFVR